MTAADDGGRPGTGAPDAGRARPVGWWLKEADARLDAAFDAALAGTGVDRRRWQLLASLARGPVPAEALLAALAPFDTGPALEVALADLRARGWVEDSGGQVRLTAAGAERQRALTPRVDEVRARVAAALPDGDYDTLVRLLQRLVTALPPQR